MTYSLSLTTIAKREINETFLWYEGKQDHLGLRFKESISSLIESIQKNPDIFQVRYSDVRIAFMKKFPYGVHYRNANYHYWNLSYKPRSVKLGSVAGKSS